MSKVLAGCLDEVVFLQATYPFAGSNEDELSFNKNDVFVVTKKDDGGWWEGTLDGKIGWFPNNYVQEISADPEPTPSEIPTFETTEEAALYHAQVVDSLIQAQKKHLDELKSFLENYLSKVKTTKNILQQQDRDVIASNYEAIVDFHVTLTKVLIEIQEKSIPEQRFGECFLNVSKEMKEIYLTYCNNHPQAADLIQQHSEVLGEYMEGLGASSPGIMHLTSLLSKPFLHVEKYGNQIKELERHVPEEHMDKLDMKKATQVLQIIALSCNEVRKKKEMQLQMLTGTIDGWQGDPITSLGSLVHMGQVFLEKEDVARRERYFCLFPNDLVVLSVSAELVGYCFEERHSIEDIKAEDVEDSDAFFNGFHLHVSEALWQVMTSSPREKDAWVDALKKILADKFIALLPPPVIVEAIKKAAGTNLERSDSKRSEVKSAPMLDHGAESSAFMRSYSAGATLNEKHNRSASSSPTHEKEITRNQTISAVRRSVRQPVKKEWSFTRLRPTPPYQQNSSLKTSDTSGSPRAMRRIVSAKNKMIGGKGSREEMIADITRKGSVPASMQSSSRQVLEEDMMILSVIEAYCFSTRQRQTMNCGSPDSPFLAPDVPPHFSFKPITPPRQSQSGGKQRSLKKFKKKPSDTNAELDGLKQQVQNLHKQTLYLRENLEEERKARENFEKFFKKVMQQVSPDTDLSEEKLPTKSTPI